MLKKILCFLLGHKTTVKAMTGQQFETYHRLYPDIKVKENYYVWQKLKFCARCGKKIKDPSDEKTKNRQTVPDK